MWRNDDNIHGNATGDSIHYVQHYNTEKNSISFHNKLNDYSTDFDRFHTFCPTTKQPGGEVALFTIGFCDAVADSDVSKQIFVIFEHSLEQHWREFMHLKSGKNDRID